MATWHLDEDFKLDWSERAVIEIEPEMSVTTRTVTRPFTDFEIEIQSDMSVDVTHSVPLDLLPLLPEKFRESQILIDWVREAGIQFGSQMTAVRDIVNLLSPNTVASAKYLRHLGALIGVQLPPEDDSTVAQIRKTLAQAIDWYKIKGTYDALRIVALSSGLTINLYDMYTDDYETFVLTDWFVGDEDENPPGLDSSYYKSPHFGCEVVLNRTYTVGSIQHLWYDGLLTNFKNQVNDARPVHTVPHFLILLNPKTDERRNVITTTGGIKCVVTSNWEYSTKYFDATDSDDRWSFDDGTMRFDSSEESFLKSINKWVLGTGNYPSEIEVSPSVQSPVLTGTVSASDITVTDEYYQWEFIVPASTAQDDMSELGLYLPGTPDTLLIVATFPKIDKDTTVDLRVVVQVYKEDLSV